MARQAALGSALALAFAGSIAACSRRASSTADAGAGASLEAPLDAGAQLVLVDARAEAAALARSQWEAGAYEGPRLGAANMVVSVLSAPLWPETDDAGSHRLGYLRHGARVPAVEGVIANEECTEGWYELVQGGFVCGKAVTTDLKSPRVKLAPKGPDLDAGLPYRYGYNLTNGTPVYRRVLSIEDRKKHEPWLAPKPPEPVVEPESELAGASASAPASAVEEEAIESTSAKTKLAAPAPAASSAPWYLRPRDGGKPDVKLGELRGRGVLVRRMVRGFFLALDRDFKAAGAKWWRSTYGFAIPFERIVLQPKLSDYHNFWVTLPAPAALLQGTAERDGSAGEIDASAVDGDASGMFAEMTPAPVPKSFAFVTSSVAVKLTLDRAKNKLGWSEALPKRRSVALTGERITLGGVTVLGTTEGFFVRELDVKSANPSPPPADLAPGEKWIDVDLTRQMLVAFEGTIPVFATLVSSGKRNTADKDKDHPTPTGTFFLREKHVTSTMDGDVAADGPYSIEDVPWVMYFQGSFALHGAFWHNGFGGQRSHGCVNLAPDDARSLFWWSEPALPEGWHGVFATLAKPGTRVVIHEDDPKKR